MSWIARAVFADDLRFENNGKLILIGVYQGEAVMYRIPANLNLATWIDIRGLEAGVYQTIISARFFDGNHTVQLGDMATELTVNDPSVPSYLTALNLNVYVDRPGAVILSLSMNGEAPRDIDMLRVRIAPQT